MTSRRTRKEIWFARYTFKWRASSNHRASTCCKLELQASSLWTAWSLKSTNSSNLVSQSAQLHILSKRQQLSQLCPATSSLTNWVTQSLFTRPSKPSTKKARDSPMHPSKTSLLLSQTQKMKKQKKLKIKMPIKARKVVRRRLMRRSRGHLKIKRHSTCREVGPTSRMSGPFSIS